MAISQHHGTAILPRFTAILIIITFACSFVLSASIPSTPRSHVRRIPSVREEDTHLAIRDTSVETVKQLTTRFSQSRLMPDFTKKKGTWSSIFKYGVGQGIGRSGVKENTDPTEFVKSVAGGLQLTTAQVSQQKKTGIFTSYKPQGQALWGQTFGKTKANLLYGLYGNSPGSAFIYKAFVIHENPKRFNDSSNYQVLMPIPDNTLEQILSGDGINKNQLIIHMSDLFQGIQHMYSKETTSSAFLPSNVLITMDQNKQDITVMQWGIFSSLQKANNGAISKDPSLSPVTDMWISPGTSILFENYIGITYF